VFATAASQREAAAAVGPCGACGNPNGQGSCDFEA
jgi:hypothetical protein